MNKKMNSETIERINKKVDDNIIQEGGFSSDSDFLEQNDTMGDENIFSNW